MEIFPLHNPLFLRCFGLEVVEFHSLGITRVNVYKKLLLFWIFPKPKGLAALQHSRCILLVSSNCDGNHLCKQLCFLQKEGPMLTSPFTHTDKRVKVWHPYESR